MVQVPDLQLRKPYKLLPQYFGSAIIVIATLILIGWQFNIQILASLAPGLGATHPLVAIAFIAIGLFFIVDGIEQKFALKQALRLGLPVVPILLGSLKLIELVFHISFHIETLLYPSELLAFGYKNTPNHITGSTALEFVLTGGTLLLMNFKSRRLDVLVNNMAGLIGLVCLLSYISCVYLIHEYNILVFYVAMAILTGVCFLLSSLAIMYSRPNSGIMSAFTSSYPGNRMARIFLPLSVVIPVVFGLITVYVLRHNVINTEVGMTLLFTSLILSMFVLTWYLGTQINRTNFEQTAAEKLRKSEYYYRSIIEQASDAIMIANSKGDYLEVNSYACDLFGYTKEELLKLNVLDLVDPEQIKSDPIRYDLLLTGKAVIRERRMVHKDGTIIETRINVKILPDGRVLGFIHDITEENREAIEFRNLFEQLTISEEKYRSLIDKASDAIWVIDFNGKFIEVNTSLCHMSGYSKEELLTMDISKLVDPEQLRIDPLKFDLPTDGRAILKERKMISKDGTVISTEWHVKRITDSRIMAIARDITELRKVQRRVQESEARFRALVENNFDSLTLYDENLNSFYRSPSSEKVTGWTNEERKKQPAYEMVHPDDLEKLKSVFENALKNSGKTFSLIYRTRHKNGHYIWLESVTRNMLDDVNIGAIVNIFRDITERETAERKLIKFNRELFMLNHINDAIVRYKDESALMNQTCRLLADYGNYRLAWIGFAPGKEDKYQQIIPLTKAGKAISYLDSILIDLSDERMKKGPVASALATGKIKVINHLENDFLFEPWHELAKQHGLASIIALPININETTRGVIAIYSDQPDSFDKEEVIILQRLSENLAYALRGIRTMKERDEAIAQIVKSEEKYRLLFESNPLPMLMFSVPDFLIIDVNEAAVFHYGYSREEFISMNARELRPFEDIDLFKKVADKDWVGINNLGIWRHKKKTGEIINVEVLAHDIIYEGAKVRLILAVDVTEKLKAEEELRQMNEQLRHFSAHLQDIREEERTLISREIHDELGQLLTGLKIDVSWLNKRVGSSSEEVSKRIHEMLHLTDRTIQSVRRIATELRPGILDDLGLEEAINWQSNEFESKTGIACEVNGELKNKKYSTEVSTAAFRILQESLTNVMRHANAKHVIINMDEDNEALHLEIIDDGIGIDNDQKIDGKSLGIMGMRERASIIGGAFTISSVPLKGTRVKVEIPLKTQSQNVV